MSKLEIKISIPTANGGLYPMTFDRDEQGRWIRDGDYLLETEVIDYCKSDKKNWPTIKAAHFVMCDFHK